MKGQQTPVMIVELHNKKTDNEIFSDLKQMGLQNDLTSGIEHFLIHPAFPVDIRHNAKIFREKLSLWAADELKK